MTSGNNGSCSTSYFCTATTGYDGPTGWGTPNGVTAFASGSTSGNTVTVTNPGSQSTTTGGSVSLQISASDSAGATLTYSASGLPTGLSISSSTGKITGTASTAGTYQVTVTAKDSTGASGSTSFTWAVGSGSGTCTSTQLLGNAGFESGNTTWTATSGAITNSTSEAAHAGSYYAWLDGYGSAHTDTLSQSVTVPSGCKATFTFYLHIDTAETSTSSAYDKLTVTAGSTTLATYSNLNKASGYAQKSFDLSSYSKLHRHREVQRSGGLLPPDQLRRGRHRPDDQLTLPGNTRSRTRRPSACGTPAIPSVAGRQRLRMARSQLVA